MIQLTFPIVAHKLLQHSSVKTVILELSNMGDNFTLSNMLITSNIQAGVRQLLEAELCRPMDPMAGLLKLHYTTLHYTTLHYTTLHNYCYTVLQFIILDGAFSFIA